MYNFEKEISRAYDNLQYFIHVFYYTYKKKFLVKIYRSSNINTFKNEIKYILAICS